MVNRKLRCISLIFAICLGFLVTGIMIKADQEHTAQVQQSLAKEVFRFHILADSNQEEDQNLKMQVKEEVLSYMKRKMPKEQNAEAVKRWTRSHLTEIQKTAQQTVKQAGYDYQVTAEVTESLFPEKSYGDVTFPKGRYEALRIKIGGAKGQNWWCVLYPNLCFMDSVRAVVPEEGKEQLKEVLTEEEYQEITDVKIKWFCLQICEGVCRIADGLEINRK